MLKIKVLACWQTRTNAVILYDSVPADFLEKVVNTKTDEILYYKVSLAPRPPQQILLKGTRQVQREDSHQRRTSTERPVAYEGKTGLKIDFRIQGNPHAAVEQEDDWIREIRRPVRQVKNHSNKYALIADLQKQMHVQSL